MTMKMEAVVVSDVVIVHLCESECLCYKNGAD